MYYGYGAFDHHIDSDTASRSETVWYRPYPLWHYDGAQSRHRSYNPSGRKRFIRWMRDWQNQD